MRVVVIGGGIAGLAAAHRATELDPDAQVTVLEAQSRGGGLIRTEHTAGFVIEHGPDAILTQKLAAVRLAERLGLSEAMIGTRAEHRGAYVVRNGELCRIPEGFALAAPTSAGPLLRSRVLSWRGKARAALDLVLPRGQPGDDESLGSFVERRFGREVLDRLAQPMAGGIYGPDPYRLSLQATMPRFLEAERTHRSVALGMRRARGAASAKESGVRYGMFVSFRDGMQTLPDALLQRLGARVRLGTPVSGVQRSGDGWRVSVEDGAPTDADAVIAATPAWRSAELLRGEDAEAARLLEAIPYGSLASVVLAWRRSEVPHPMDAFGFVVPAVEERGLQACTWLSVKWPGRAPDDMVLLRAFVSGEAGQDVAALDDGTLESTARRELRELMGIEAEPSLVRVSRYNRALPRYELGHLEHVARIEQRVARHPGLALAGNAYRGVGIPDSVAAGEAAAEQVVQQAGGRSARSSAAPTDAP